MGIKMSSWYSQVMTASGCSCLTAVNWPLLGWRIFRQNGLSTVTVRHFSPACSEWRNARSCIWAHVISFLIGSAHVPFWQLSINLNLACAYNFKLQTALPWESVVSLVFWKVCYIKSALCRGKTTSFSSEPARLTCDIFQRISDLDSCQFILIPMAYITDRLGSISEQDLMWHLTSAYT